LALILSRHFLDTYSFVEKARVYIEQSPWQRIDIDGKKHRHAFIHTPVAIRFCTVRLTRNGFYVFFLSAQIYFLGNQAESFPPFRLQVLRWSSPVWKDCEFWKRLNQDSKTLSTMITVHTFCPFYKFKIDCWLLNLDCVGSLPDTKDRVFSTVVFSRWEYSTTNVNFCKTW
jgi:urate oxidase